MTNREDGAASPRREPAERRFGPEPDGFRAAAGDAAPRHDDAPVVLRIHDDAFRAHADRVVLEDAGIEARVIDAVAGGLGLGPNARAIHRIELVVRASDLDEAARVLDDNRRDSVDIDWNEVDLGEPQDAASAAIAARDARGDAPGASRPMPIPARLGWFLAALLLLVSLVLGLVLLGP